MSQLHIRTSTGGNFRLNVLAFSSPIFGSVNGVQTKNMKVWYPIKANQPEVSFDVQFMDEQDYEAFQKLVRDTQTWSLTAPRPMIHLDWPERNINNWSGMITEFVAGGMKGNPAPRAKFTVYLVDSYISQYSEVSTIAPLFAQYFSFATKVFTALIPNPYNFQLPTITPSQNFGAQVAQVNPNTLTPTTETQDQQAQQEQQP
jgi:hypothetical protein